MRRSLALSFVPLMAFFGLVACSAQNSASAPSGGGASGAEVDRCKSSCDKMKFFDCSSAEEQARCYADCDKATSSQIQVFAGCAENSICDPACRTTIQPKDSTPSGGTSSTGGSGASASTCASACDKLVSCNLIPIGKKSDCNTQCTASGYQYQVDCVNHAECSKIASTCGGASSGGGGTTNVDASMPDPGVFNCQSACDALNFSGCITADDHATCRSRCSTATSSARDTFSACTNTSAGECDKGKACLDTFLK